MSKTLNSITLIGYVGAEPEYKRSSKYIRCSASMATNHWGGNMVGEVADWHYLVFWGELAERAIQEIHKGSMLVVQGELQYYSYDTEGIHQKRAQIIVKMFSVENTRRDSLQRVKDSMDNLKEAIEERREDDPLFDVPF